MLLFNSIIELDRELFLFLNSINGSFANSVMWFLSSKEVWVPLYIAIMYYFYRGRDWRKGLFVHIAVIILIVLCDQISASVFKPLFERPRPTWDPVISDLVHTVKGKRGGHFGFVSSHASNVFGLATITVALFRNRWVSYFIVFWAVIVSYSRVYLGVHYPGDILCGGILGVLLGILVYKLLKKFVDVREYKGTNAKYISVVGITTILCILLMSKHIDF